MGPAGAVGRHLAAGRRAGPLGPRHPGLSAQPRAEHLPLSALRPRGEGATPRGRSPDRSGLAQSSRSPGPVADPPGGRRVGRTPTTDLPKERQPRGRRYDQLSALRSQGPARAGTPKSGGPQRRSCATGGWHNQPYGPPGRRSCGLRFGCRTVGEHGAAWVIRHVLVNHACVPKSHPAIGETALGAPTKRPRSIEAGHNPGDVSACLRGHGPGRAVTPAHRWAETRPVGWTVTPPGSHRPTQAHQLPADATGKQANAPGRGGAQRPRAFAPHGT